MGGRAVAAPPGNRHAPLQSLETHSRRSLARLTSLQSQPPNQICGSEQTDLLIPSCWGKGLLGRVNLSILTLTWSQIGAGKLFLVAAGFAEAGSQCWLRRQDVLTTAAIAFPVGCSDRRAVTRLLRLPRCPRPLPHHPLRGEGHCVWRLHSSKAASQGTDQEYQWPSKKLMPSHLMDVWYKIVFFPRSLRLATDVTCFPRDLRVHAGLHHSGHGRAGGGGAGCSSAAHKGRAAFRPNLQQTGTHLRGMNICTGWWFRTPYKANEFMLEGV